MADLPARPDLGQLRHQAKDLLRAAQRGDPEATARIRTVSERIPDQQLFVPLAALAALLLAIELVLSHTRLRRLP